MHRRLDRRNGQRRSVSDPTYGGPERRSGDERRNEARRSLDRVTVARSGVRRAQAPRLRHVAIGALTSWAFVASVGVVALVVQAHRDDVAVQKSAKALRHANDAQLALRAQQDRQHVQLQAGCERLNVQRALYNRATTAEFALFRVILQESVTAARARRETGSRRARERVFLRVLRRTVDALQWTPLTDCAAAVALRNSAYSAPEPISFSAQRPPPSQLDTRNARLPSPSGSVP